MHFALAFAVSGALCAAVGILAARERLERFGGVLLLLGTGAIVLAVASGYLAANTAPGLQGAAAEALGGHERLALLSGASLLLLVVWKGLGRGRIASGQRRLYALALLLAAALLVWTALLGGRLVYEHAVGIATEVRGRAQGAGLSFANSSRISRERASSALGGTIWTTAKRSPAGRPVTAGTPRPLSRKR